MTATSLIFKTKGTVFGSQKKRDVQQTARAERREGGDPIFVSSFTLPGFLALPVVLAPLPPPFSTKGFAARAYNKPPPFPLHYLLIDLSALQLPKCRLFNYRQMHGNID